MPKRISTDKKTQLRLRDRQKKLNEFVYGDFTYVLIDEGEYYRYYKELKDGSTLQFIFNKGKFDELKKYNEKIVNDSTKDINEIKKPIQYPNNRKRTIDGKPNPIYGDFFTITLGDFNIWTKNRKAINNKFKPSIMDILKMKRPNKSNHLKYLINQDENADKLTTIIGNKSNILATNTITFIPFIPEHNYTDDINPHNIWNLINILNTKEFVNYLKTSAPYIEENNGERQIGEFMFELNKIIETYQLLLINTAKRNDILNDTDMGKIDSLGKINDDGKEDATIKTTILSNLGNIIKYHNEKYTMYGLNKETVKLRLEERQDLIKSYIDSGKTIYNQENIRAIINSYTGGNTFTLLSQSITDEEKKKYDNGTYYKEHYDNLSKLDTISSIRQDIENIRKNNASMLDLENLLNENNELNTCSQLPFAATDIYSSKTNNEICKEIIEKIRDIDVKKMLSVVTDIKNTRCLSITDNNPSETENFKINEMFIPEWYHYVKNADLKNAFKHRQLLLGNTKITLFFRNCSIIFRSDPFISRNCYLPGLSHDIELNKAVVACIANSNDIFPIRLIDAHDIEKMDLYEDFKKTDDDKLIGAMVVKVAGDFKINYLYYNKTKSFKISTVGYRSNIMVLAREHMRVLRIEMNTLMYFKDDNNQPLYFYKYDTDKKHNKFDIYVSRYKISTIKEKYTQFKDADKQTFSDINFLDELKSVLTKKDETKKFKFLEYEQNDIDVKSSIATISGGVFRELYKKNKILYNDINK